MPRSMSKGPSPRAATPTGTAAPPARDFTSVYCFVTGSKRDHMTIPSAAATGVGADSVASCLGAP